MTKHSNSMVYQNFATAKRRPVPRMMLPLVLILAGMLAGCKTQSLTPTAVFKQPPMKSDASTAKTSEAMSLREGDVLKISFPGSPTLDTTQQIRHDGKISMQLVGDVDAAGMTPAVLEAKLVNLYAPQLSSKQVTVEVVSSLFPVYVTGMVLRPGKILPDHPITALEAVMEAGGFDFSKADVKDVVVIRREGNIMKNYKLNLKAVLEGKQSEPFYLKPDDIVYVPERFSMF
jgi:polysaccharide export outer membrane protein